MLNSISKEIFSEIIELSEINLSNNKVPIAAIIYDYKNKQIVSKAVNTNSPIGHAELEAIREALQLKNTNRLDDCDIYVSIEPCLMCATAISKCHIRRVYFGAEDEKGGAILNGPRIYENNNLKKVEVISHIEKDKTSELLKKFFRSKRNK
ncbi:MAG: nucleoside deaminase [Gammaproteobacteria bacterium]|jgi:tRNA(Arg) A34 adenosine deaminase TadA|nr:adenosine deaminase [Gammaproteobacteria bacterium]|tara:strand:- start:61 stop:513 length:453 start_codon:yes stop_codon:yes gene_type:complete